MLSQNQGSYYGCKILHSGAAFFSYVTLFPWCPVFCDHPSAPVSQLHCGLWLVSSLFFSGLWHLIHQIVAVLENGDFSRKSCLWACEVSDQCTSLVTSIPLFLQSLFQQQRNKWSHFVSFIFFSLKLNLCSSSSVNKLFIIKRENDPPLYVLLSSDNRSHYWGR